MKKKKENYQSLIQMLRDFKIDEIEAAKIILSNLGSGRPKSKFKLDMYFSVIELMNKKKYLDNQQYYNSNRKSHFPKHITNKLIKNLK